MQSLIHDDDDDDDDDDAEWCIIFVWVRSFLFLVEVT